MPAPAGPLGDGPTRRSRRRRGATRGDREAGGGPAADQRLPRARPPDRRPRPARRAPSDHPRLDPPPTASRSGTWTASSSPDGLARRATQATLREILDTLRETYCGTIGVEYMHIQDPEQQALAAGAHGADAQHAAARRRRASSALLERLIEAESFEHFLHTQLRRPEALLARGRRGAHPDARRADRATPARLGVARGRHRHGHRGRLNVLANIARQAAASRSSREFEGSSIPTHVQGDGRREVPPRRTRRPHARASGETMHRLARRRTRATSRPSTRWSRAWSAPSRTRLRRPRARDAVAAAPDPRRRRLRRPGRRGRDAQPSQLAGYTTGGTLHFIVNNQIGFTTDPDGRALDPLLHRHREDVEAPDLPRQRRRPRGRASHAAELAFDVPPEVPARRRDRHGLLPPPRPQRGRRAGFTQPLLYAKIKTPPVGRASSTATQLVREGVVTDGEVERSSRGLDARKQRSSRHAGDTAAHGAPRRRRLARPAAARAARRWTPRRCRADARARRRAAARHVARRASRSTRSSQRSSSSARTLLERPGGDRLGARPRRSPSARCCSRACRSASPARTASAARSASATPSCTTRRPGDRVHRRCSTSRRRQAPLRGLQQPALRGRASSASSTATAWPTRDARALGGAVRRLRQRRAGHHRPVHRSAPSRSGASRAASCCSCRTATRARGRSTPARASSASCSSAPRTTSRSPTAPRRRSTSTCCAARRARRRSASRSSS